MLNDNEALKKAITAFEKRFHCKLCMHDYCGELDQSILPQEHLNHYCTGIKKNHPEIRHRCIQFDSLLLQQQFLRSKKSLWKQCPFGVVECVFPIIADGDVCGCLFAGTFSGRPPETGNLLRHPNFKASHFAFPGIPEDTDTFMAFGELIAENIGLSLARQKTFPGTAREIITEFFRNRHRQNVGLADAAELLGLTPARASEKIKREFGENFAVLLTEYRLKSACRLLKNSMFSMEQIALQSGFSSGSYFFRVFKKKFGITPEQWRRQNLEKIFDSGSTVYPPSNNGK